MKKTLLKAIAVSTAALLSVGMSATLSTSAMTLDVDNFDFVPEGYTLVEDAGEGYFTWGWQYDYRLYQKATSLYLVEDYSNACLSLVIPAENYDSYTAVWETYEDSLTYTTYRESNDSDGNAQVKIYDYSDQTSTTKAAIAEFVATLTENDIVTSATYTEQERYGGSKGGYNPWLVVTNLEEDDPDTLLEIAQGVYADTTIREATESDTDENLTGISYCLVATADISVIDDIAVAVHEVYPEAILDCGAYFLSDGEDFDISVNMIDLMEIEDWSDFIGEAETLAGDIDGDGEITPNDSYLCLVAYANTQLGLDTGLTDAQMVAADVNGDGDIDSTDSYYILVYYATEQTSGTASWEDIIAK